MKESRKADLTFIYQKMAAASGSLHASAQKLGVAGFVDYANRVTVYVERCKTMLDADEDFTEFEPHNDVLRRLQTAEMQLEEQRRELDHLRDIQRLAGSGEFDERVETFERVAYARVEQDLKTLGLWVASGGGTFLTPHGDGSLLASLRNLRAQREQVALTPKARVQLPATPTDFPQSFAAPEASPLAEDPVAHPPYPFSSYMPKKEDP